MMEATMDRETLGAYADGELAPEEAAAVARHLAGHPDDQAYVERVAAGRAAIARAFAPIAAAPLPAPLLARVEALIAAAGDRPGGATVVPLRRPPPRLWLAGGALAAAAAALLAVYLGQERPAGTELALGPLPSGAPIAGALDSLSAGVPERLAGEGEIEIVASFADGRGRLCRELRLARGGAAVAEFAIACAADGLWTVEAVAAADPVPDGADRFETAAGPVPRAIEAALDALGAGPVLTPEEEAAAKARGWRP
jgi:anti-sigma factor RsiW